MIFYEQQYLQIDFLRFFRLCRSLGIVNRKRKMPAEYDDNFMAEGAGRRLLKTFLEKYLFADWPKIRVSYPGHRINVLPNDKVIFNLIKNISYDSVLMALLGSEWTDAYQKYVRLGESNLYIYPYLPYEIVIYSKCSNNKTNDYRPQVRFYDCALECIKYKELWDNTMRDLHRFNQFYNSKLGEIQVEKDRLRQQRLEQERVQREAANAQREVARVAYEKEQREAELFKQERRAALAAQVLEESERRKERAQSRFEQSLSKFRGEI